MNLRDEQLDLLAEWINIGMGQAASILHDMLQSPIRLRVPNVAIASPGDAVGHLSAMSADELSAVYMKFDGSFKGTVALMFPSNSAAALMNLLYKDGALTPDMDGMKSAALTEVGNILLNSVMGSIVNLMRTHIDFSLPFYAEDRPESIIQAMASEGHDPHLILARTNFAVERNDVQGCIVVVFEITFLSKLGEALDRMLQSA